MAVELELEHIIQWPSKALSSAVITRQTAPEAARLVDSGGKGVGWSLLLDKSCIFHFQTMAFRFSSWTCP